jgi:hypothetical protein
MPAKDLFHNSVKNALQKEGWVITHEQMQIKIGTIQMYIDLGAERLIIATKGTEKIAVEVKSFLEESNITNFYPALGQFIYYRAALAEMDPDRKLYLACPLEAYNTFLCLPFNQKLTQQQQIHLLIFNPTEEVITQWIE